MTQVATVKRLLEENRAEVLVLRRSACGHDCASCGGCGPDSAARMTAPAENAAGARVGDTVLIESESGRVLSAAFVLYLVPLVLLFVGYFLASGPLGLGEGGSLMVGLAGLAAGIGINIPVDRRLRREQSIQFRITEVLKSCSDM